MVSKFSYILLIIMNRETTKELFYSMVLLLLEDEDLHSPLDMIFDIANQMQEFHVWDLVFFCRQSLQIYIYDV